MLTTEENELLTRVGPGTPCGELMRRYWHPIAAAAQLLDNPVRRVRILCEDLVLYQDRQGGLGLIEERCPHRAVHLEFGIPEQEGLRCPYHGWMFNALGQCIEQPLEPPDSTFKEKVQIKAYQVAEMGGLIWAYLGPQPAPLLPRWDLYVRDDGFREIIGHTVPCNWLQVMENRGDPGHGTYLHSRFFQYILERQGRLTDDPEARYNSSMNQQTARLRNGAFQIFRPIYHQYGFAKGIKESDRADSRWAVRNTVIFPYMLSFGPEEIIRRVYQIGVPIDDTTTWHISYHCYVFPEGVDTPHQEHVPYTDIPIKDEEGEYILDYTLGQDMAAWYSQGEITDRTREHLGTSDVCIIAYRKMLRSQIEVVMDGGEPMAVFRDPSANVRLTHPFPDPEDEAETSERRSSAAGGAYRDTFHHRTKGGWLYMDDEVERLSPLRDVILDLYNRSEQVRGATRGQ